MLSAFWAPFCDCEYAPLHVQGHALTQAPYSTARIRRLGIRNLQVDDYLMMFAVVWYTLLCVALNQVASGGGSNLMTDEDRLHMTPQSKAERIRGSKWVFVSEHSFILCVWGLKACMLVIYARITYVTKSHSREHPLTSTVRD